MALVLQCLITIRGLTLPPPDPDTPSTLAQISLRFVVLPVPMTWFPLLCLMTVLIGEI